MEVSSFTSAGLPERTDACPAELSDAAVARGWSPTVAHLLECLGGKKLRLQEAILDLQRLLDRRLLTRQHVEAIKALIPSERSVAQNLLDQWALKVPTIVPAEVGACWVPCILATEDGRVVGLQLRRIACRISSRPVLRQNMVPKYLMLWEDHIGRLVEAVQEFVATKCPSADPRWAIGNVQFELYTPEGEIDIASNLSSKDRSFELGAAVALLSAAFGKPVEFGAVATGYVNRIRGSVLVDSVGVSGGLREKVVLIRSIPILSRVFLAEDDEIHASEALGEGLVLKRIACLENILDSLQIVPESEFLGLRRCTLRERIFQRLKGMSLDPNELRLRYEDDRQGLAGLVGGRVGIALGTAGACNCLMLQRMMHAYANTWVFARTSAVLVLFALVSTAHLQLLFSWSDKGRKYRNILLARDKEEQPATLKSLTERDIFGVFLVSMLLCATWTMAASIPIGKVRDWIRVAWNLENTIETVTRIQMVLICLIAAPFLVLPRVAIGRVPKLRGRVDVRLLRGIVPGVGAALACMACVLFCTPHRPLAEAAIGALPLLQKIARVPNVTAMDERSIPWKKLSRFLWAERATASATIGLSVFVLVAQMTDRGSSVIASLNSFIARADAGSLASLVNILLVVQMVLSALYIALWIRAYRRFCAKRLGTTAS